MALLKPEVELLIPLIMPSTLKKKRLEKPLVELIERIKAIPNVELRRNGKVPPSLYKQYP